MRQGLICVVAAIALTGEAMAADLPTKAVPVFDPPVSAVTWTGFYLGVQGGYSWDGAEIYASTWSYGMERSGPFGGVVAGYNYQINKFVLGVQGEYNFSDIENSVSLPVPASTLTTRVRSFGSIDGRVGLIYDRFLIYAIGGFAFGDLQHSITLTGLEQDSFSAFQTGYDWGGGVEYAIVKSWSVRAEYRHYDFGHKDFAAVGLLGPHSTNETLSTVRLGVVYLFGG